MLFNSVEFAFFLPIVLIGAFSLSEKLRIAFLLVMSYFFYGYARPEYILLLVGHTVVAYFCALKIEGAARQQERQAYLVINIIIACSILFLFKYYNFFMHNLGLAAEILEADFKPQAVDVILPIGISFYTFQTLSYTIDVYRRELPAEKSIWRLGLFVAFFPHLVAGPILRASLLLPQIVRRHAPDIQRITSGFAIILLGLIKKVVIADRLAIYVDAVFADPSQHHGLVLMTAIYFFAIQIYCDFSGYSDIAVGAARMLGIDLIENFKKPYLSRSPQEFWHRWHVSLSTWIRDYLYLPLGGSRTATGRWIFNILFVFTISGLWHGANWTFVLWGCYHGALLLATHFMKPWLSILRSSLRLDRVPSVDAFLCALVTFHLVCLGWILFRASSIGDVWTIMQNLTVFNGETLIVENGLPRHQLILSALSILLLLGGEFLWERFEELRRYLETMPVAIRWSLAYFAIFLILLFPGANEARQFIYFQF